MEDIIAIRIKDGARGTVYALTWGRLYDPVDFERHSAAIQQGLSRLGFHKVKEIHLCDSLQEAANATWFYEGLVWMSWKPIPFGVRTYPVWKARMRRAVLRGKEIYLAGPIGVSTAKRNLRRNASTK